MYDLRRKVPKREAWSAAGTGPPVSPGVCDDSEASGHDATLPMLEGVSFLRGVWQPPAHSETRETRPPARAVSGAARHVRRHLCPPAAHAPNLGWALGWQAH